jgi:hypothetical protein
MAERKRTESDAKTHRTPKALRAKSLEASIWFRESFGSATASSRRFRLINILICLVSGCGHKELFRSRKMKYRVIDGHVGFDFIDNNSLLVRRSFAAGLD